MVNNIVSETEHSMKKNASVEKTKKRAAELKMALSAPKRSSKSISTAEIEAQEAAIVEELNRIYAVIHTSSTYILIEKTPNEFVLDSKSSLLSWYENQPVSDIFGKEKGKVQTKAMYG